MALQGMWLGGGNGGEISVRKFYNSLKIHAKLANLEDKTFKSFAGLYPNSERQRGLPRTP
jgi:hypothetical protein